MDRKNRTVLVLPSASRYSKRTATLLRRKHARSEHTVSLKNNPELILLRVLRHYAECFIHITSLILKAVSDI